MALKPLNSSYTTGNDEGHKVGTACIQGLNLFPRENQQLTGKVIGLRYIH